MPEGIEPSFPVRIALIEDDSILRAQLIDLLTESGRAVVVYEEPSEQRADAWLAGNADRWDLAIIDVFIAQGNGLKLLGAHRLRLPHQRIAMLTGFATPQTRMACKQLGADAVFDKLEEIDALIAYCVQAQVARSGSAVRLPRFPSLRDRQAHSV